MAVNGCRCIRTATVVVLAVTILSAGSWLGFAPRLAAESRGELSRGVRLLDPGDEMTPIAPFREPKSGTGNARVPPLDTIRVAVADGSSDRLAALIPHVARFETVTLAANPDLVWDATSRTATAVGGVVAYDVDEADLPAVIDRMAVVRGMLKIAAAKPQPIELSVALPKLARTGERIEIEVTNMARRALILFDIAGDGTVQALYPFGSDERIVQTPTFRFSLQTRAPFGADLIVAISATAPMEALERGLKEISNYRSAGEILNLIAAAAPADVKIGCVMLWSTP